MSISKRIWRIPLLLGLGCVPGLTQTSNPYARDQKAAEAGAGMFQRYCASCHGRRAQGGRAPDLTSGRFNSGEQDADLFRTISAGLPGSEMRAYADRLSSENIWRIITFLRSVITNEAPLTGDAAHGEALFWGKGGCGNCHVVGKRGNRLGPDLSRIGGQRGVSYLRESLVAPSADIVPNFEGITVVTRDGKTIRGLERAVDDFSVVLVDFSGKFYSFNRSDVQSVTRDTQSLMPEYGKVFSDVEMNDLVVYLATLGRSEVKQ